MKNKDQKRMDAIRRELKYWNTSDYSELPLNIRMLIRSTYLNLTTKNRAIIADELKLKFGTGKILFME